MLTKILVLFVIVSLGAAQEEELEPAKSYSGKSGYIHSPGLGHYRLVAGNPEPWAEARRRCEEEGASLFVANSRAEVNFIKELVRGNNSQFDTDDVNNTDVQIVHTGFHDLFIEGEYLTTKSEPLIMTGFVHWKEGHPIGDTSSNCGGFDLGGYILDISCKAYLPWICEIPEYDSDNCSC